MHQAIQEYVRMVHLLQIESCHLLILYLLHFFQNNPADHHVLPIHRKRGGIMHHFYAGIISSFTNNDPMHRNPIHNNPEVDDFIRSVYLPTHCPATME